jgi:hypothetical protein
VTATVPAAEPVQQPTEGLDEYVEAVRLLLDRVSSSVAPPAVLADVADRLRAAAHLLEPYVVGDDDLFEGVYPALRGRGTPAIPPFTIDELDADGMRGHVTFRPLHATSNVSTHGGQTGLFLVDVVGGFVFGVSEVQARTASFTVDYRAVVRANVPLAFDVTFDRREGRKLYASARVRDGDVLCLEAHGLFVQVRQPQAPAQP